MFEGSGKGVVVYFVMPKNTPPLMAGMPAAAMRPARSRLRRKFGMNYIFTNRNKNSGLQAAEFHNVLNVTKVYNVLQTMLKALRYERYKPYKLFIDCVFRFPII